MLLATPLVPIVNHLLRGASWAPQLLQPFATRTLKLISGPVEICLTVTRDGFIAAASNAATSDLVVELSPLAVARFLAGDRTAQREARISGDQQFAQSVATVIDQLRWDAEEDLSRIVGDIAAHRLASSFRTLIDWQRSAAESFARNVTEYWVEEAPLIASRHETETFIDDVSQLRDDVERLAKRIDQVRRAQES